MTDHSIIDKIIENKLQIVLLLHTTGSVFETFTAALIGAAGPMFGFISWLSGRLKFFATFASSNVRGRFNISY